MSMWGLEDNSVGATLIGLSLYFLHKSSWPLKWKNASVEGISDHFLRHLQKRLGCRIVL